MFWIARRELSKKYNFPLINRFVFTGETPNPWRCECCARNKQRIKADKEPVKEEDSVRCLDIQFPQCCRKCGCDF